MFLCLLKVVCAETPNEERILQTFKETFMKLNVELSMTHEEDKPNSDLFLLLQKGKF